MLEGSSLKQRSSLLCLEDGIQAGHHGSANLGNERPAGCETRPKRLGASILSRYSRSCRHFWTLISWSCLKSANSHRHQAPGPRSPDFPSPVNSGKIPGPQPSLPENPEKVPDLQAPPILKIEERSQILQPSHVMYVFLSFVLSDVLSFLLYAHVFNSVFFLAFYMSVLSCISCISAFLHICRWFMFLSFVTVSVYSFLNHSIPIFPSVFSNALYIFLPLFSVCRSCVVRCPVFVLLPFFYSLLISVFGFCFVTSSCQSLLLSLCVSFFLSVVLCFCLCHVFSFVRVLLVLFFLSCFLSVPFFLRAFFRSFVCEPFVLFVRLCLSFCLVLSFLLSFFLYRSLSLFLLRATPKTSVSYYRICIHAHPSVPRFINPTRGYR